MGNFIVNRPFIYVFGTIIDPNQNNPNETTIYGAHNASMNGLTGHTHTGAVGDGPIIGASGINLAGNYPWTGNHSWTQNIKVFSGSDLQLYSDAGVTLKFDIDGATGDLSTITGGKISLNLAGTVFIKENPANVFSFTTGGSERLNIQSGSVNVISVPLSVQSGQQIYADGGSDTGLRESSANVLTLFAGGNDRFNVQPGSVNILNVPLIVSSGQNLYLDGGIDDYWINSANGQNDLYSAGTLTIRTKSTGEVLFPSVDPPTANYMNRNSGMKGAVNFVGSSAAINASYNVSGVVRNGAGDYTISWNTDFSTSNYFISAIGQVNPIGVPLIPTVVSLAAGTSRVTFQNAATTQIDPDTVYVMVMGTQ